jgi:hypothetical protein
MLGWSRVVLIAAAARTVQFLLTAAGACRGGFELCKTQGLAAQRMPERAHGGGAGQLAFWENFPKKQRMHRQPHLGKDE